jgi:hypothetical protein
VQPAAPGQVEILARNGHGSVAPERKDDYFFHYTPARRLCQFICPRSGLRLIWKIYSLTNWHGIGPGKMHQYQKPIEFPS